jgi:hypothetical protein
LSEDGVALAFADRYGRELRFCHGPNRWYRWDGTCWKREQTQLAFDWIRNLARQIKRNAVLSGSLFAALAWQRQGHAAWHDRAHYG